MIDDFKNKTAVLTGAGSGFGLETARLAAARGMNLVLVDVHESTGQRELALEWWLLALGQEQTQALVENGEQRCVHHHQGSREGRIHG